MRINYIFNDLAAEAGSTGLSADGPGCEETVADFWRHAATCVNDVNIQHVGRLRCLAEDGHGAAGRNLGDGVVHQIVEGSVQPLFVSLEGREPFKARAA